MAGLVSDFPQAKGCQSVTEVVVKTVFLSSDV